MQRTIIRLVLFLQLVVLTAAAQESIWSPFNIEGCRYWFDKATTATQASYIGGQFSLNISGLSEGFHTLHYQILDSNGGVSPARMTSFFIPQRTIEIFEEDYTPQTVRYWFDLVYTPVEVPYVGGASTVDMSGLSEGFHIMHYQVIDNKGATSPVRATSFFVPQRATDTIYEIYTPQTVRYWFDLVYTPVEVPYVGGASTVDMSALPEGFHIMHYQVIDDKGATSPVRATPFFVPQRAIETIDVDYTPQTVRYWFDKLYAPTETVCAGGAIVIDVSALSEGVHVLYYQIIDNKGVTSPVRSSTFFRVQKQEEIFNEYDVATVHYWFDDKSATTRTAPFTSGLIPMDLSFLSEGAHSMCYQVLTDDGQVSPARTVAIDRWLYDIYVSKSEEYSDSTVSSDPLFATRPDLKLHFLADDTSVRGHLTVDEGTLLSLGKYVQTANWGSKNDGNKYTKAGVEYYHPTTLVNHGTMRADSVLLKQSLYRDRWHFLSLPFNANVGDIDVPEGTYWALRAYDGEARAAGQMTETWQNLRSGDQMEAGRGYIVQLTKEGSEKTSWLTFKSINDPQKNNLFTTADVTMPLQEHLAEFAHNRSWNLVGNPYPCFFDSRCIDQDGIITVWNGNGYAAYSLQDDSYVLMPFEAFFIQKPVDAATLTFSKEGRQHTHQAQDRPASARREASPYARRILNFTLANGQEEGAYSERSRVVISEQATMGYEQAKDAPKFMEARPQTAQLFSVERGVQYAINERPMGDGRVVFSLYAPAAGEYRFSLEGDAADVTVLDAETGTVWALADGDYVFTATEGMHHARLVVSLTGEATAIAQVNAYADGEVTVADGRLNLSFMRDKHVQVFALDGKRIYAGTAATATIALRAGIYVLDIDGKKEIITVK